MMHPLLSRRSFLAASLASAGAAPAILRAAPPRRNVLFIASDDLNHCFSAYGHDVVQTPNLDRIARNGVRFDRAYCQFPLCSPSRTSLLTGLAPDKTGVYELQTHFRKNLPEVVTLPQVFQKNGYLAARVGKLYHYGVPGQIGTSGLDDAPSWQQAVNPRGRDRDDEPQIFSLRPGQFGGTLSWLAAEGADAEQTDGIGAAEAIRLMEAHRREPFFLAVGFYRPHTPYVAPRPYFERYPLYEMPLATEEAGERERGPAEAYASAHREQDEMSDFRRRQARQAYYASITFMDAQVGRLLDALDRLRLAERTIVVFHSDHGYHLGEHGLWQKMSLYEESARVPLIIYDPRSRGASRASARTVELIDLYPTLADLCGLPTPQGLDGASLAPLLRRPDAAWDHAAYTEVRHGGNRNRAAISGRTVRTERFRYTEWESGGRTSAQLFDHTTDPGERQNLAGAEAYRQYEADLLRLIRQRFEGAPPKLQ